MATMHCNGVASLMLSMSEIEKLPPYVCEDILNAQADVVVEEQIKKGKEYGVWDTGDTVTSIKKTVVKYQRNGLRCIYVYPQGNDRDGHPTNEVGFINNYGKDNQPPRMFITDANNSSRRAQHEAAEQVFTKWLQSQNVM